VEACVHPVDRLYAYRAYDGDLVAGCCECEEVLLGGGTIEDGEERIASPIIKRPEELDVEPPEWVNRGPKPPVVGNCPPPERANMGLPGASTA